MADDCREVREGCQLVEETGSEGGKLFEIVHPPIMANC